MNKYTVIQTNGVIVIKDKNESIILLTNDDGEILFIDNSEINNIVENLTKLRMRNYRIMTEIINKAKSLSTSVRVNTSKISILKLFIVYLIIIAIFIYVEDFVFKIPLWLNIISSFIMGLFTSKMLFSIKYFNRKS